MPNHWLDLIRHVQLEAPLRPDSLGWQPEEIILTRGCDARPHEAVFCERLLACFPGAKVTDARHLPHNRVKVAGGSALERLERGKRTLVLGAISRPVSRNCDPETDAGTLCTPYHAVHTAWFCFYDCAFCYLSGSPGVRFSPTVRLFTNLVDILAAMEAVRAERPRPPVSFYVGKVQDGLQLDGLSNASRVLIPFVRAHPDTHLVFLTKSDCVEGAVEAWRSGGGSQLVSGAEDRNGRWVSRRVRQAPAQTLNEGGCRGPSHAHEAGFVRRRHPTAIVEEGRVAVSWSLSPPEVAGEFEARAPSFERRLEAARRCAEAGLEVRFIFMPLLPVEGWREVYSGMVRRAFEVVTPSRVTLGAICSYPGALAATGGRLGAGNLISDLARTRHGRRLRFDLDTRRDLYRHVIAQVRAAAPEVPVSLCLESAAGWEAAGLDPADCRCNCIADAWDLAAGASA